MKPPLTYFGGKTRLAERMTALLPAHQHYVEPFAGSLAVLLAKPPAPHETVNDLDGDLQTFWRVLRDQPGDLMRVCALTPHSRAEHAATYQPTAQLPDVERARRVWVQLTQGRAGVRSRTGWRHYAEPGGSTASMPDYLNGYIGRMSTAAARLKHVSLECRPALDVIRDYGKSPNTLLYVDPPYLGETRSSGAYLHEMDTPAEHRELADALHAVTATVVLSGYHSDLYDGLYAGWDRREIPTGTGQGGAWENRTEVVWCNHGFADQGLFDLLDTTTE